MNGRSTLALAPLAILLVACSAIGALTATNDPESGALATTSPASSSTPTPATTAEPSTLPSGTPGAEIDGRQFVSLTVDENGTLKALVPGTKIRLAFASGNVSASAGCNTMGGDYRVSNGKLVIGELATTDMGCPGDLSAQDIWLSNLLSGNPDLTLDGTNLVLTSDGTVVTFVDRRVAEPDQPLAGITWGLTSIVDGETASSVPDGVSATILFTMDGQVQFDDGCNAGGGQYTVDGESLHFSQVVSTMMACPGARGDVSGSVRAVLGGDPIDFSIDGTTLTLKVGDKALMCAAAVDITSRPSPLSLPTD